MKQSRLLADAQYSVFLASCGNPDFGQDPRRPLPGIPCRYVLVASFAEAARVCREYIEAHQLGAGNWFGGQVKTRRGKVVARVSYNGRVWAPDGSEIATR